MKKKHLLIFLSFVLMAALPATAPAQAVVAMLVDDTPGYTMDDDEQAAYDWFKANYVDKGTGKFIKLDEVNTDPSSTPTALEGIEAIWVCIDRDNENDFTENIPDRYNWGNIKDNLRNWYKAGGNLLLTNHATVYAERLGRIDVKPNIREYGAGPDNSDTWGINLMPESVDHSTHPLFKRLPIQRTTSDNIRTVNLQDGNHKENHNCLWNDNTIGANNAAFESAHNATVLAGWGHANVPRCAGIVEFNPTGDYQGRAIAIGVAAYEWHTNEGTNQYRANIERMTANALAYLAPSLNQGDVAYLIDNTLYRTDETAESKLDDDEIASWQWFEQTYADKGCVISCQDIEAGRVILSNFNTLWIAIDRPGLTRGATNLPSEFITDKVKNAVTEFYKAGGNLLLTNHATQYLALTGRVRDFQEGDSFESNNIEGGKSDIWDIRTNVRQAPDQTIDRSGHPLYVGLEVSNEEGKYIHLMNAPTREDFNSFWIDYNIPITTFQETYQCTVVGTWPNDRHDLTGIVDFRPCTRNETTYRGRAIAIGLAAYEWHANEGTNTYQSNIEQLTQNAIAYLNSKWNGSTPTGTWSEGAYKAAFADGLLDKNATSIDLRQMTGVTTVPTVEGLNPNCLVYANAGATGKNVIVNGTAAQITLSEGGNFNVPETFTAQNIQYTREFANTGWFSTTLPFVPTDLGSLQFEELANVKNTGGALSLVFSPVALPEAGKPYIVHVGTAGSQTFSATNVQVSGTTSETNGTGAVMRPCYATTSGEGKYMLKADGSAFAKGGASSTIGAFRAYIELTGSSAGAPARLVVSHTGEEGGGATNLEGTRVMQTTDGLAGIYANTEQDVLVYSANGQLIDRLHLSEGFNALTHLPKGLYLVNQQKLIIR